jgi:hypothetical protein
MPAKPSKQSAIKKIERSQLSKKAVQAELMGHDFDLQSLLIYFKSKVKFDSIDRVTDINVSRTVEGASTITVTINDADRAVLRSGNLNNKLDVQIDGLWFRLVKVEKQSDTLTLTFEDRDVAVLRGHNKLKIVRRTHATRAEFINNLIRETDKELSPRIATVIPSLHKVQPIEKAADLPGYQQQAVEKVGGIPEDATDFAAAHHMGETVTKQQLARNALTVKGKTADKDQIKNCNIIVHVGQSMGARRKVIVASIMTAIQESTLRNLPYGDRDSLGLFQQRDSWGSKSDRLDPATAARLFFNKAIPVDKEDPTRPYWDICQTVQVSALPDAYAQWRTEAERMVTAYGIPGGDIEGDAATANNSAAQEATSGEYIFYRGVPASKGKKWKKEDSWTCIQRLAEEVGWRAFFVSGVFYYISEDELFKSKPLATLTEFSEGVEGLDGDYDSGKKSADVTLTARVGTWLVPPGSLIVLQDMGPWNGRWLVNTFERSLFDAKATITLKKPRPKLPEPLKNDINTLSDQPTWGSPDAAGATTEPIVPVFGGVLPKNLQETRDGIVAVAEKALAEQKTHPYKYLQDRPYPDTLWSVAAHNGIDCSAFVTLVYKEASCDDPNGNDYDGQGFTGTLINHGTPTISPRPGDLVFYRGRGSDVAPGHVALFVGNGMVIEIGSNQGVSKLPYNYRTDIVGYRSYMPL